MEKKLVLKNEIAEINKLALFIEELGEELNLTPELVFNLNLVLKKLFQMSFFMLTLKKNIKKSF